MTEAEKWLSIENRVGVALARYGFGAGCGAALAAPLK